MVFWAHKRILTSFTIMCRMANVMEKANLDHRFDELYFLFKRIAATYILCYKSNRLYFLLRPPVRDLQGPECPNSLMACAPVKLIASRPFWYPYRIIYHYHRA